MFKFRSASFGAHDNCSSRLLQLLSAASEPKLI
jgi:hypothetical protein